MLKRGGRGEGMWGIVYCRDCNRDNCGRSAFCFRKDAHTVQFGQKTSLLNLLRKHPCLVKNACKSRDETILAFQFSANRNIFWYTFFDFIEHVHQMHRRINASQEFWTNCISDNLDNFNLIFCTCCINIRHHQHKLINWVWVGWEWWNNLDNFPCNFTWKNR